MSKGHDKGTSRDNTATEKGETEAEVNSVSSESLSSRSEGEMSDKKGGEVSRSSGDNRGAVEESKHVLDSDDELDSRLAKYRNNAVKMEELEIQSKRRVKNLGRLLKVQ